jgi:hypothetical protein
MYLIYKDNLGNDVISIFNYLNLVSLFLVIIVSMKDSFHPKQKFKVLEVFNLIDVEACLISHCIKSTRIKKKNFIIKKVMENSLFHKPF